MNTSENLFSALKKRLNSNEPIIFAYRKKTGELRVAKGTTNLNLIPKESHPTGNGPEKSNVQAYWDINVDGWRAFNPLCLVYVFGEEQAPMSATERETIVEYLQKEVDRINATIDLLENS